MGREGTGGREGGQFLWEEGSPTSNYSEWVHCIFISPLQSFPLLSRVNPEGQLQLKEPGELEQESSHPPLRSLHSLISREEGTK